MYFHYNSTHEYFGHCYAFYNKSSKRKECYHMVFHGLIYVPSGILDIRMLADQCIISLKIPLDCFQLNIFDEKTLCSGMSVNVVFCK